MTSVRDIHHFLGNRKRTRFIFSPVRAADDSALGVPSSADRPGSRPPWLLIRHRRAGCSREMDDLNPAEPNLQIPSAEIGTGEIEGFAELDQHVQRHEQAEDIFAAGIVDEGLDGAQRAAGWESGIGGADHAGRKAAEGEPERLYLVRETKSVPTPQQLRDREHLKIQCARRHFDELGVDFKTAVRASEI